jgi:hypothetical protein
LQCPQQRLGQERSLYIHLLAWVALWRPGKLLLYDGIRDAKLLGKLEQQVIEKAKEQVDEHCDYPAKSDNRLSAAG